MRCCPGKENPMDDERTGEGLPLAGTGSNLAGILADYFEKFDITHPGPLPHLEGEDPGLRRLEAALSASVEQLGQTFGDLRRYTSNVSHELLNPLSVIKGKAEVTLLRPRSKEFYERKLTEIIEHTNAMRNMIEALLELSRLDLSDRPSNVVLLDLEEIAQEACQRLTLIFNRRGQQVEKEIHSAKTMGRSALILALAANLLDNASKYSPPGGLIGIRTYRDESTRESILEVWDTGPGMSEEEIRQCFDLFWRADGSRHMPGYGIGLPLVYRIAQIHGGKIEMHSGTGEGLLFRVRFPEA